MLGNTNIEFQLHRCDDGLPSTDVERRSPTDQLHK